MRKHEHAHEEEKQALNVNPMPSTGLASTPAAVPVQPVKNSPNMPETLGIISIVLGTLSLAPIGLVLGLIGAHKAKKQGVSPVLPRIGWIVNLIFMGLIVLVVGLMLAFIPYGDIKNEDNNRSNKLSYYQASLEVYYSKHGYYPQNVQVLTDLDQNRYSSAYVTYKPLPEGCIKCNSYVIRVDLGLTGSRDAKYQELQSLYGQPVQPAVNSI